MYRNDIIQLSPEWWAMKVGKVSGTRFGQLISGRENSLIDELANEILDGRIEQDDFQTEDMMFGTKNEEVALSKYEDKSGVFFQRGGVIISDIHPELHIASPDGITECETIIAEVKCTRNGKTQINRLRNGIDKKYIPQVLNYFAVSDKVKEVHWISYCPYRPEIELVTIIVTRDTIIEKKKTVQDKVNEVLAEMENLKIELDNLLTKITQ
jgi:hypothetical protein